MRGKKRSVDREGFGGGFFEGIECSDGFALVNSLKRKTGTVAQHDY